MLTISATHFLSKSIWARKPVSFQAFRGFVSCKYPGDPIKNGTAPALPKGTKWGYETTKYGELSGELINIEKCLRGGCKTLFTRSSANWSAIYELLQDLWPVEEIDLKNVFVGHRLDAALNQNFCIDKAVNDWSVELKQLAGYRKHLSNAADIVSVPSRVIRWVAERSPGESVEAVNKFLSQFHTMSVEAVGNNVTVGIDFTTEDISSLSDESLESQLKLLNDLVQNKSSNQLSTILVATNAFTVDQSPSIIGLSSTLGFSVVSTEVLRADSKRPALLTDISAEIQVNTAYKGEKFKGVSIEEKCRTAMQKLNVSLNNCIYLENGFEEKILPTLQVEVDTSRIFWGRNLAALKGQIHSYEEWVYFRQKEVEVALKPELQKLKTHNSSTSDWVKSYSVTIHETIATLEDLYMYEKQDTVLEVKSQISSSLSEEPIELPLSLVLGAAAVAQGSSCVLLPEFQFTKGSDEIEALKELEENLNIHYSKAMFSIAKSVIDSRK